MSMSALETLQRLRSLSVDHEYAAIADLVTEDAIYVGPLVGVHRGRDAIRHVLEKLSTRLPAEGLSLINWHIAADTNCGWSEWDMLVPGFTGRPVEIPGWSLHRLRDGLISFLADDLDTRAYRLLRGVSTRPADHAASLGLSASPHNPRGDAYAVIERYSKLCSEGQFTEAVEPFSDNAQLVSPIGGTLSERGEIHAFAERMQDDFNEIGAGYELVDIAGDETVGWSQWWFRVPTGAVPGRTMFTLDDGRITFAREVYDADLLRQLASATII